MEKRILMSEALHSAEILKWFCQQCISCKFCPFYKGSGICMVGIPEGWKIPWDFLEGDDKGKGKKKK